MICFHRMDDKGKVLETDLHSTSMLTHVPRVGEAAMLPNSDAVYVVLQILHKIDSDTVHVFMGRK